MADLKLGSIKPVGADNVVVEGKYVKGGYVTVTTLAERDTLKGTNGENIIKGSLCYVTGTESAPVNKFYQYNGTDWVERTFATTVGATESLAGLMTAADKAKLDKIEAGAEVNVQAQIHQVIKSGP